MEHWIEIKLHDELANNMGKTQKSEKLKGKIPGIPDEVRYELFE